MIRASSFLGGVLAASAIAAAACESVPLTAPSGTTITFISATTMVSTQTLDITVSVIQGTLGGGAGSAAGTGTGQPVHDNTAVSFTSTLGTVSPAEGKTSNGVIHLQLIGDGRAGAAKITATSGGITGTTTITVTASTVSGVSIALPGAAGVESTPANFSVNVGASTGVIGVTVDFGDGSAKASLGALAANVTTTTSHLYATTGVFTVAATAIGNDGGTANGFATVAIAPLSLTPFGPATVAAGSPASFAVTPTTGALIDHYEWNFGDGTSLVSSSDNSQSHVFAVAGAKTVAVTVFPQAGASRVVQIPVQVT